MERKTYPVFQASYGWLAMKLLTRLEAAYFSALPLSITNADNSFYLIIDKNRDIHAAGEAHTWLETEIEKIYPYLGIKQVDESRFPINLSKLDFENWETRLVLDGTTFSEEKSKFRIIFSGFTIKNWQPHGRIYNKATAATFNFFFTKLPEDNEKPQPGMALLSCEAFDMHLHYYTIEIERF